MNTSHRIDTRKHWMPVGIILCSADEAVPPRYVLDTLPNKVMAREYQLALPELKRLEAELRATRKRLERAAGKHDIREQGK